MGNIVYLPLMSAITVLCEEGKFHNCLQLCLYRFYPGLVGFGLCEAKEVDLFCGSRSPFV